MRWETDGAKELVRTAIQLLIELLFDLFECFLCLGMTTHDVVIFEAGRLSFSS